MATGERRFPRDLFTKKLCRLCERLDEAHQRTVTFTRWWRKDTRTSDVSVTSLWVAGSYARGAVDCGDLDIVFQASSPGEMPGQTAITRTFFGTLPHVRYYLGDPQKNASGVEFPDAVQIWSGPASDWRKAIGSIKPDAAAGRAKRDTDIIPLRTEQLHSDLDDLGTLVEEHAAGLLEWDFVEFNDELLAPIPEDQLSENEQSLYRRVYDWGRKSQQLLSALVRLMREREPYGSWKHGFTARSTVSCGGTEIRVGRPSPWTKGSLDSELSIRQLALVPHLSTRGPNGAWLLRRGPKHPGVSALAARYAYYLTLDGKPSLISSSNANGREAMVLELFTSEADASDVVKSWKEDDVNLDIALVREIGLLELTGLCDVIDIDGTELAVNWAGRLYTEQATTVTIQEVAARLPSK
jgi:hypothetical protein